MLSRTGFWPKMPLVINPKGWLDNFLDSERDVARALLESFIYLNQESTEQLLISAFRSISTMCSPGHFSGARTDPQVWDQLRQGITVTYPTGENPNPTDSGHLFVRRTRQVMGISETQIMDPGGAVQRLIDDPTSPLVMIDDFAGSGDQFLKTWTREYDTSLGRMSLANLAGIQPVEIYYVAAIVTWMAHQRITVGAPGVRICSGHRLSGRYSVTDSRSVVLPDSLRTQARAVISASSARAGILPAWNFGYHGLALTIAFSHSVPDATLPIYWHQSDTWKALVPRS